MTSSMEMAIIIAKSIEIIMPKIIFFLLEGLYFLSINVTLAKNSHFVTNQGISHSF